MNAIYLFVMSDAWISYGIVVATLFSLVYVALGAVRWIERKLDEFFDPFDDNWPGGSAAITP